MTLRYTIKKQEKKNKSNFLLFGAVFFQLFKREHEEVFKIRVCKDSQMNPNERIGECKNIFFYFVKNE